MEKNLNISYLLDFYADALTLKQKDVMEQYYNNDLSLAEIAANCGITRQGVRDAIKRGESVITELENQIGFAKKYRIMQKNIEHLESLAKSIQFINDGGYSKNQDISNAVDEMLIIIKEIQD